MLADVFIGTDPLGPGMNDAIVNMEPAVGDCG